MYRYRVPNRSNRSNRKLQIQVQKRNSKIFKKYNPQGFLSPSPLPPCRWSPLIPELHCISPWQTGTAPVVAVAVAPRTTHSAPFCSASSPGTRMRKSDASVHAHLCFMIHSSDNIPSTAPCGPQQQPTHPGCSLQNPDRAMPSPHAHRQSSFSLPSH